MINIKDLKEEDKGEWVEFTQKNGKKEQGILKSWNDTYIFVVFNCNNEWYRYQDYTAQATMPEDLTFTKKKFDYYKAPSDSVFNNIKENAIKLWQTFDDTYGYATEKVSRIERIHNTSDNAWYIVAMFDLGNQGRLIEMLDEEARNAVLEMLRSQYENN